MNRREALVNKPKTPAASTQIVVHDADDKRPLIIIATEQRLTKEQAERAKAMLKADCDEIGCRSLFLHSGCTFVQVLE